MDYTATLTLTLNTLALFGSNSAPFPRSILHLRLSAFPITAKRHFGTSVGTEELGHMEMISAIVYQLTRGLCMDEIKESGFDAYFVDHTTGIYPVSAAGVPFTMSYLQCKGDIITDLHEDLAAEQKARTTYDNILRLVDDPDIKDVIRFLRERELVHYQRFGEALRTRGIPLNRVKLPTHLSLMALSNKNGTFCCESIALVRGVLSG